MQDAMDSELHAMLDAILQSDDNEAKRGVRFLIQIAFAYLNPVKTEIDHHPTEEY